MARLQVNPTRIELKKCKTRLKTASSGHKLLKDKSDEMVRQFLALVRETKAMREEVEKELTIMQSQFAQARAYSSEQTILQAISMPLESFSIETGTKTVMGCEVPSFSVSYHQENKGLPYALASAPPELASAISSLVPITTKLLKLGELEKACAMLAEEIEKNRRRVNALEHIIIPQLKETIHYILMKMDENERAALVRLIKVKSKLVD
ncbi:MAG: V-type ATP synthase subunit D [Firmicutes bacterium]|nr:V-type ATP synthase subunit D [Bacillota bacterium]